MAGEDIMLTVVIGAGSFGRVYSGDTEGSALAAAQTRSNQLGVVPGVGLGPCRTNRSVGAHKHPAS